MSDPHAWRDRAACHGQPVAVFFPTSRADSHAVVDVISRWCLPCPVRRECLGDELARPTTHRGGIRGGVLFTSNIGGSRVADPFRLLGQVPP